MNPPLSSPPRARGLLYGWRWPWRGCPEPLFPHCCGAQRPCRSRSTNTHTHLSSVPSRIWKRGGTGTVPLLAGSPACAGTGSPSSLRSPTDRSSRPTRLFCALVFLPPPSPSALLLRPAARRAQARSIYIYIYKYRRPQSMQSGKALSQAQGARIA